MMRADQKQILEAEQLVLDKPEIELEKPGVDPLLEVDQDKAMDPEVARLQAKDQVLKILQFLTCRT